MLSPPPRRPRCRTKSSAANVVVNVHVPKADRDTRAVVAIATLGAIALGWVGLITLRRVVGSARDGEPFDARNVGRLRMLGTVLLAVPLLATLGNRVLENTFDAADLNPRFATVDVWLILVIAFSVFALAEVFRQGTALRELEQTTI